MAVIEGDTDLNVAGNLLEKVDKLRSSVAAVRQEVIAPIVWVGSQSVNVMQLMLETLDVVKQLAELTANHTHNNTGAPLNATSLKGIGSNATNLKAKYNPVIG